MKIRFWDRLILFFGAVLTVAAGVFLVICGLQFLGVLGESLSVGLRAAYIAGGAVLMLFGVYLLVFPRKFASGRHDFVVQQTDNGELRIAVKAIENLVQKCIDMHEEIRLESMRIRNGREGVTVDLRISLANNISIPLAVASLQKQIKQYLVASSGIEVKEVRVSVETTQTGVGDSPYLVPADQQPQTDKSAEKPAVPRKKAPLHQRIFGKVDQPVNMPEPPTAEELMEDTEQLKDEESAAPEEAAQAPRTEQAEPAVDEEATADIEKEDETHE